MLGVILGPAMKIGWMSVANEPADHCVFLTLFLCSTPNQSTFNTVILLNIASIESKYSTRFRASFMLSLIMIKRCSSNVRLAGLLFFQNKESFS